MDIQILFPSGSEVDINTTLAADFMLQNGQLVTDESLYTATVISLFSDERAKKDDELPAAITNRRGWWGDGVSSIDTPGDDVIGSRLWLLFRRKQTENTRKLAIKYAKDALAWTDAFSGILLLSVEYETLGGSLENYAFSVPFAQ